jgi:predicted PurR-regulated permease PerM
MSESPPLPASVRVRPRSSVALVLLVTGLGGVLLFFAQAAFIPIALALLFALMLSSPVEALNRVGVPRSLSAVLIIVLFLSLLGGTAYLLRTPAQQWLAGAPHVASVVQQKLEPATRILQRIDSVTNRAGHITDAPTNNSTTSKATLAVAPAESGSVLAATRTAVISALTVVILTLFLLAAGSAVLARTSASFASDTHAAHLLQIIRAVRREVGRYYATIALINFGLGLSTFCAMWALGMPNPVLWGVMAGVLNFIPYIGSATTLLILTVVAFVSFDGLGRVLAVSGSYLALATIEGQVIQPLLVGHRLELNPIIVFLALWFGGWFWGIPGIILAIPSLVTLKVAAENSERGRALVEFLSPDARRLRPRMLKRKRAAAGTAAIAR